MDPKMGKVQKGEKHFTASVWVVTKNKPKKVLLIHHKKLDRWLQLGGHIEQFENPVETAIRETQEESGVDISFLAQKIIAADNETKLLLIPDFLVEQFIPHYQDTPEHYHLDMQYIVEVEEQELKKSDSESHDIGWFSIEEALKLRIHEDTKKILQKIL
jgi:8-oxo-dGTP pyrophosphatase MutT (NUDIX family)